MRWFHLPIADVSIPDERFETQWDAASEELCSLLRGRLDVLVHCRGGLGRAGTIAARLLVELGMEPKKAIVNVRAARPGAIETTEQQGMRPRLRARRRWNQLFGGEIRGRIAPAKNILTSAFNYQVLLKANFRRECRWLQSLRVKLPIGRRKIAQQLFCANNGLRI